MHDDDVMLIKLLTLWMFYFNTVLEIQFIRFVKGFYSFSAICRMYGKTALSEKLLLYLGLGVVNEEGSRNS